MVTFASDGAEPKEHIAVLLLQVHEEEVLVQSLHMKGC